MRTPPLVGCMAALLIGAPASSDVSEVAGAADAGRQVVRAGRYTLRYFGRDIGEESFVIERTEDGYEIRASVHPDFGDQVPSESIYRLSPDKQLVSATYQELSEGGARAQYRVEDGVLIADGWQDGQRHQQRVQLEPGAIVTGPHYVTDFFVLAPLELDVGDRTAIPCYTFGFSGWQVSSVELDSRREQDKRTKDGTGVPVDATVYRCRIKTSDDTYKTRSWLADDGVSVRITIAAPIGSVDIRLHPDR